MFPSQRGNFFPNYASTTRSSSPKYSRSFLSASSRFRSPPLGISALNRENQRSGDDSTLSPSTEDRTTTSGASPQGTVPKFGSTVPTGPHSIATSKHFMSTDPPMKSGAKSFYEVMPSVRKIGARSHKPRIIMSQIPSAWSNHEWSLDYPYYEFNQPQHGFIDLGSVSSNSTKVGCERKDEKCDYLPIKTQQERLLVKKLCDDAMKSRRDVSAFYSNLYEEEMSEATARLSSFEPKNHKGRLCEFMLKLVLERQQLLDTRRGVVPIAQQSILKEEDAPTPRYTPVYCISGKTILGQPYDSISFPNTFALLSELHDPKDDPKGYRRFCTLVNMKGFQDSEIFLRVTGNCLTVDGVHWRKHDIKTPTTGCRVLSNYVDLPKGVYPDRLTIGRSADGILVIQEPWKF